MFGNQDILEKSVFPKEFKPCISLIFSSSPLSLLSNWESVSSGFNGCTGGGPKLMWERPPGFSSDASVLMSSVRFSLSTSHFTIRCTKFRRSLNFSSNKAMQISCVLGPLISPAMSLNANTRVA
jgi:hypothetical protein